MKLNFCDFKEFLDFLKENKGILFKTVAIDVENVSTGFFFFHPKITVTAADINNVYIFVKYLRGKQVVTDEEKQKMREEIEKEIEKLKEEIENIGHFVIVRGRWTI